jgi:hypothetical protein
MQAAMKNSEVREPWRKVRDRDERVRGQSTMKKVKGHDEKSEAEMPQRWVRGYDEKPEVEAPWRSIRGKLGGGSCRIGGGSCGIGGASCGIDGGPCGIGGGDGPSDKVKASQAETMRNPRWPPPIGREFPHSHNIGPWATYKPATTAQEAEVVEEEKTWATLIDLY